MSLKLIRWGVGSADTVPNAFPFTPQTSTARSATITSAAVTISGITGPSPITVSGGLYDINGSGSFVSTPGFVNNGDTVRARHTSSASNNTATNTTVTIGGVAQVFTDTTFAATANTYTSGSGTDTVPAGATQVVISMNGRGGNGQSNSPAPGAGGGGGGNCIKTSAVSGGQTFSYSLVTNSTVTSGSPSVSLAANVGSNGAGLVGGPGGSASGGDTNTTGSPGSNSVAGGASPNGGATQTTPGGAGNAPGGGGAGGIGTSGSGAPGQITFSYT